MELFIIATVIRVIAPLLIPKFPIAGITLSLIFDFYDWDFLQLKSSNDFNVYQIWDKSLDLYYQLFILSIVLRFKDRMVKNISILLLAYRFLGLAIAMILQNRQFLFYFPNLFDNFVIFYLIYKTITKQETMPLTNRNILAIYIFVFLPKIIHEFMQHYLLKQPWEIFDFGKLLGATGYLDQYANDIAYSLLLYIIPIMILIYILTHPKIKL